MSKVIMKLSEDKVEVLFSITMKLMWFPISVISRSRMPPLTWVGSVITCEIKAEDLIT